ncbi:hypothetical protein V6O07_02235 [Arthrospira platensis SPKY2]
MGGGTSYTDDELTKKEIKMKLKSYLGEYYHKSIGDFILIKNYLGDDADLMIQLKG